MNNEISERIIVKLNAIIKLMVLRMTEGKSQVDQIKLLSLAGLPPKEIAETLGTTSNTVNVTLSNLRKQKTKRSRKNKSKQDSEGIGEQITKEPATNDGGE
jgi:DNA-binding CsgD family transcriptional regulator